MAETWTVLRLLQWTEEFFGRKGLESARLDAQRLLAQVLELDRVGLYLQFDRLLSAEELAAYRRLVERRAAREPLQYILGRTEFWSLELEVNPAVLIPRTDTEVLVEEALARGNKKGRILDIGTGSGALAVALARELPESRIEALDISAAALEVAKANARRHGLDDRIELRQEDLHRLSGGPYDLMVANPPYIPAGDLAGLMPEVRDHEPRQALDGGADGLDAYRSLAGQAANLLASGGWLLVEVGIGQAEAVAELFAGAGLQEVYSRPDYAGIPRVVGGKKAARSEA